MKPNPDPAFILPEEEQKNNNLQIMVHPDPRLINTALPETQLPETPTHDVPYRFGSEHDSLLCKTVDCDDIDEGADDTQEKSIIPAEKPDLSIVKVTKFKKFKRKVRPNVTKQDAKCATAGAVGGAMLGGAWTASVGAVIGLALLPVAPIAMPAGFLLGGLVGGVIGAPVGAVMGVKQGRKKARAEHIFDVVESENMNEVTFTNAEAQMMKEEEENKKKQLAPYKPPKTV